MTDGPTANLVSGEIVACYKYTCDIYDNGEWTHLVDTRERRVEYSTAVKDDRLLLIGNSIGSYSRTTEWIPIDGSLSQPGPFDVRHAEHHCTLQISNDIIIVTGGMGTFSYVTEYHLTSDGIPLSAMSQPRDSFSKQFQW